MKKIIILFSGTASNLENIIETMHKKDIQITATFTNNKNARGINISQIHNIPCLIIDEKLFKTKEEYNQELIKQIQKTSFDLVILAGYMRIVPKILIDTIKTPIINIHPSLLPLHKGLSGAKKSFDDDSKYGGVSVHYVTPEVDDGEIIQQYKIDKTNLSFSDYEKELKKQEFKILPHCIKKVLSI
jgi:phosphoribosylglycinamide formyltransferase-1